MPTGTTGSAIEAMRLLVAQIDPSVEALIEAHGFSLARMNVTPEEATAVFTVAAQGAGTNWVLTLTQVIGGPLSVALEHGSDDHRSASLRILVGTNTAATLGEAAGLAVSFPAFCGRLRESLQACPANSTSWWPADGRNAHP